MKLVEQETAVENILMKVEIVTKTNFCKALIDTGANISCIDQKVARKIAFPSKKINRKIELATGEQNVNETVEGILQINSQEFKVELFVIKNLNFDFIFGGDVLKLMGAKIDYENELIESKYGKINYKVESDLDIRIEEGLKLEPKEVKETKVTSPSFGIIKESESKLLCANYLLEKGSNTIGLYNPGVNVVVLEPKEKIGSLTSVTLDKHEQNDELTGYSGDEITKIKFGDEFIENLDLTTILKEYFKNTDPLKPIPEKLLKYKIELKNPNTTPIYVRNFKTNPLRKIDEGKSKRFGEQTNC